MKINLFQNKYSIPEIVLVAMFFVLSGSIYSQSKIVIYTFLFLLVSIAVWIWTSGKHKKISHRNFSRLLGIGSFLILHCLILTIINAEPAIKSYIQVMMILCACFFMASTLTLKKFKYLFVNIIVILAVYSLFVFFLALFLGRSNIQTIQVGGFRSFMGMNYTYQGGRLRNSGLFWEPGAYQIFLNFALLIMTSELGSSKESIRKNYYSKIFILSVAVLSTYSTTGYFMLALNLIVFLRNIWGSLNRRNRLIVLLPIGMIVLAGIMMLVSSAVVTDKIDVENRSYWLRTNDFKNSIPIITQRPILGYGYLSSLANTAYKNYSFFYTAGSYINSVGLFSTIISFGIPYVIVLFCFARKNIKIMFMNNTSFALIMFLLVIMTESILELPVFLIFVFDFKRIRGDMIPELCGIEGET